MYLAKWKPCLSRETRMQSNGTDHGRTSILTCTKGACQEQAGLKAPADERDCDAERRHEQDDEQAAHPQAQVLGLQHRE